MIRKRYEKKEEKIDFLRLSQNEMKMLEENFFFLETFVITFQLEDVNLIF